MKLIRVANFCRVANHMFRERTQNNAEWKDNFDRLNAKIDEALSSGDDDRADMLEMELEAFLEHAEAYLSEIEEGNSNEDLEPDEHGAGSGFGGQTGGVHYLEEIPSLYEEYLMAKEGKFVERRISGRSGYEDGTLDDDLAYHTFLMLSVSQAGTADTYLSPEKFLERADPYLYHPTRDPKTGKLDYENTTKVKNHNTFKEKVKPEKKQVLIDTAKDIWEKRVALIRKYNPEWEGYWGYFE